MPTLQDYLTGNATLGDYASGAAPFLSAWQTNQQKNRTDEAYKRAMDLIQTPSPDQAKYRSQLSDLMTNPASFYESPVYKNLAEQGRNALERSQSARQILGSGGATAELQQLGMQEAAKYYYPQATLLSSLSGVAGDQAARSRSAEALLQGTNVMNEQDAATLGRLGQGFGVQSPQEKLFREMIGQGGTGSGGQTLSSLVSGVKNWFSPEQEIPDYSQWTGGQGTWLEGLGSTNLYDIGSELDPGYVPELADMIWG